MKILLIQPNPRTFSFRPVCASLPLGLLYVAAALRQAGCGEVSVLDARMLRLNHKEISARIRDLAPDLVGLTGMSTEAEFIHALARLAKEAAPRCKVVVGGPYATTSPEEAVGDPNIDFAVLGEGEGTACELAAALAQGGEVAGLAGLAYKKDGRPAVNPRRPVIEDIDSLPMPAWDLVDVEKYFHLWVRHSQNPFPYSERIMPLFTSRGCPYGCVYCHNIFGKKTRLRSVDSVLREIELLVEKYGVGEIEITDDIFNIDLPRAKAICDGIVRRGIKIKISFPNGLRVDRMDEELVLKLRAAGTHALAYAIESGSPAVQRRIGKNLDLEKARQIIRFTYAQGIIVCGFFMLGFPDETKEELLSTARFAREVPFHQANFFFVTPRPNTALYEMARNKISAQKADTGANYFNFSVNLSAVSDSDLRDIMEEAGNSFYHRPVQFLRVLSNVPNKLYLFKVVARYFFLRGWA
ncbi:MAG TPA: radical SAM protein [Elusimicrobiales bacterium]|nr:radical SAM protein [Elusimicrobiales bacterium]